MFDENNTETTFAYADNLDRPTQIVAAPGTSDSSATSFSYIDTPLSGSVTTTQQQESCGSAPGSCEKINLPQNPVRQTRDLARRKEVESQLIHSFQGPISSSAPYSSTASGARSKPARIAAPWAPSERSRNTTASAASTAPRIPFVGSSASDWTTTGYDALGRVIQVTHPDGSMATTGYVVNVTIVTDEAGKSRQNTTNALGQLTQVVEDPGGPLNYLTTYGYNALGNLTQVNQTSQTRTFVYNSLSQLISAHQPREQHETPSPTI